MRPFCFSSSPEAKQIGRYRDRNPDSPFWVFVSTTRILHFIFASVAASTTPCSGCHILPLLCLLKNPSRIPPFAPGPLPLSSVPFGQGLSEGPSASIVCFLFVALVTTCCCLVPPPARRLHLTQPSSCICVPLVRFFVSPSFSCSRLLRRHLPLLYSAVHLSVAASLDLPKCIRLQSGARHQSAKRPPSSLPALTLC